MSAPAIRSVPQETCYLCQETGSVLYEGLSDRLFGARGIWNIRQCENAGCGLLWLDPVPADLSEAYESYYTHEDSPKHTTAAMGFAAQLRWFVRFGDLPGADRRRSRQPLWLKILSNAAGFVFPPLLADAGAANQGKLLDIGCGDGDLLLAAKDCGWVSEGIDADYAAVEFARRRSATVDHGSLLTQNYKSDTFDCIVMSHSIEHVPDLIATLTECHRILKAGGRLVLATPNVNSQFHRKFGQHWVHLDPPRHLYLFGPRTLAEAVRQSGFQTMRTYTTLGAPFAYGASDQIRRNGRFRVGDSTFSMEVQALAMMMMELLMIKCGGARGEELRLLAIK